MCTYVDARRPEKGVDKGFKGVGMDVVFVVLWLEGRAAAYTGKARHSHSATPGARTKQQPETLRHKHAGRAGSAILFLHSAASYCYYIHTSILLLDYILYNTSHGHTNTR